jgi:predicted nucleic acid-binding protein
MTSSSFPDVNLWLAPLREDHNHRASALSWWNNNDSGQIGFCRFTQLGVLRLLTTSAAMNGKPLTSESNAQIVTFDNGLAAPAGNCVILG